MSLRWKADGTAKCGIFTAHVDTVCHNRDWRVSIYTSYEQYLVQKCHAYLLPKGQKYFGWKTEKQAQRAAERWLRKQAQAMLRDLGGM